MHYGDVFDALTALACTPARRELWRVEEEVPSGRSGVPALAEGTLLELSGFRSLPDPRGRMHVFWCFTVIEGAPGLPQRVVVSNVAVKENLRVVEVEG